MQKMTIYTADCRGNPRNNSYPNRQEIHNADDLIRAVAFDHVCAQYGDSVDIRKGNPVTIRSKRSVETFIKADCLPMDLDNDHSDNPDEWKTLEDVKAAFPDVMFYAVPSRNHMKPKQDSKGKIRPARPKYHVYFPIDETDNVIAYTEMKEYMVRRFPWFDDNAKDAARFLFGVSDAQAITVDGESA
jgi:putative DNA primase/helicase